MAIHQQSIFRSDFETAVFSSVRSLFPHLSIKCCFFHFGQANWRKISEHSLLTKHVDDLYFSLKVCMFRALAFLYHPTLAVMSSRKSNCSFRQRLKTLRCTLNGHERTLGSEPRTTNFLEGWHRHISSILGQAHPNIGNF